MTDAGRAWTKALIDVLFEPEVRRFQAALGKLIEKNARFAGPYANSFNCMGKDYGRYGQTLNLRSPPLAPELHEEMAVQLRLQKMVDLDRSLITQILYRLVDPCETNQDIRDALPECLVELQPYLRSKPRTREPAYTLTTERDLRQYAKFLPKIEMYCAVRLLY